MKYRIDPKTGNRLSILGFGCMRFPPDMDETRQLVVKAIEEGVNYFDTAYIYSNTEERLGRILSGEGLRDRVYLATKLPLFLVRRAADFERYFQIQLNRLKTDHIDYYLMHMLSDAARWDMLREQGIEEWLQKKKQTGAIRQIGFSFHGSRHDFLELLDIYDWDFCQIQYNYSDENDQAGVTGLKRAAEKGLPVIIMEPLLGGKLVNNLPQKASEAFRRVNPELTPAGWGLRWLWDQPEVTVVLSGMNEETQLYDNLRTAEQSEPFMLDERERAVFKEVREIFMASQKVKCTGCNYCMPCPQNVNIPVCFNAYNMSHSIGFRDGLITYIRGTGAVSPKPGGASRCVGCGKCEGHCPQRIEIRKNLKAVERRLEPFWVKGAMAVARMFMGHR